VLVLNELALSRHPFTFVVTVTTSYIQKYDCSCCTSSINLTHVQSRTSNLYDRPGLILFPQADNATRTLTFACRMCEFVEVDDKRTPIYRNDLLTVTREQAGVTTDLANDITLVSALLCFPFYAR